MTAGGGRGGRRASDADRPASIRGGRAEQRSLLGAATPDPSPNEGLQHRGHAQVLRVNSLTHNGCSRDRLSLDSLLYTYRLLKNFYSISTLKEMLCNEFTRNMTIPKHTHTL